MEAKDVGDVAATIDVQVKDYASHIKPEDIPYTVWKLEWLSDPLLL